MLSELKKIGKVEFLITFFVIVVCYGFWMVNVTTPFELYSFKGSLVHNFLTYYFQYRGVLGLISALFLVFNPYFFVAFAILFLLVTALLLQVLFKRLGATPFVALAGACVWFASPFFLGYATYGSGMAEAAIGTCLDALFLLLFQSIDFSRVSLQIHKSMLFWLSLLLATVCSIYEAHVSLLLTGCLGVMLLSGQHSLKCFFRAMGVVVLVFSVGILIWAAVHKVPPFMVEYIGGLSLPKMEGSHNTVFWLDGKHSFIVNCKGFLVGVLINWLYTSLFVHGLRFVIMLFTLGVLVGIFLVFRRKFMLAVYVFSFTMSIFAFPLLQCSTSNLRTHYFFMPFVGFGVVALLKCAASVRWIRLCAWSLVFFAGFLMMRETSTQYYYRWKVSHLDDMHWTTVCNDLFRKYGLDVAKPVVFIGGFLHYPTVWDDLRPNRHLPLLNNPFVSFSYFSGGGVPREAYIIVAQKIGLALRMPPYKEHKRLRADAKLRIGHPSYPQEGYIFEMGDVIIVNLGSTDRFRRFRHEDYLSPSELFANQKLHLCVYDQWIYRMTEPVRKIAKKYPWVWNARGGV